MSRAHGDAAAPGVREERGIDDEFGSIAELQDALRRSRYLADLGLTTALFLAHKTGKPLLLEGEAGVGKTEAAKAMAQTLGTRLIRLQCYEGLDVHHAVYDWNFTRQIIRIKASREREVDEQDLFTEHYLIRRPILEALDSDRPVVLLIDEIDRADEEFEAFLLELLADFQFTIPELGTISARSRPLVVLTSNRTRELHDALKRRCLFHWIDHPSVERETQIIQMRIPAASARLASEISHFVSSLRKVDLAKAPGVAESVDWAETLSVLNADHLDLEVADATLGAVLKNREDLDIVRARYLAGLVEDSRDAQ